MKIKYPALAEIAEVSSWALPVSAILHLTHTYYCGPMTVKSNCTAECSNCAAVLKFAFHHAIVPRKPAALLTYALRNAVASYADTQQANKPVVEAKTDKYGLPMPEATFQSIVAELTSAIGGS
jgi:hypothetical protein